jgi:hypothetical protein
MFAVHSVFGQTRVASSVAVALDSAALTGVAFAVETVDHGYPTDSVRPNLPVAAPAVDVAVSSLLADMMQSEQRLDLVGHRNPLLVLKVRACCVRLTNEAAAVKEPALVVVANVA